jgi:ribosomal protein L7/L12
MAKTATTRSEVLEAEYTVSATLFIRAAALLVAALLCFWFAKLAAGNGQDEMSARYVYIRPLFFLLGVAGGIAAAAYTGLGIAGMKKAKERPTVSLPCPYCGFSNAFLETPTVDYVCEGCHRTVHYEDGKPVEIMQITCAFCKTEHKVSARAKQYVCDRCNRSLRLTDPNDPTAVVTEQSDVLMNYDVKLTDPGRNRNEVAMALQDLLVCNLPEARRQMENLPLTVVRNVPERKADAVRRRLRDLGANAVVVATANSEQVRSGRPV